MRGVPTDLSSSSITDSHQQQKKLVAVQELIGNSIDSLSISERAELIQELRTSLKDAVSDFEGFREVASQVPNMEWIANLDGRLAEQTFEQMSKLVGLFQHEDDGEVKEEESARHKEEGKEVALQGRQERPKKKKPRRRLSGQESNTEGEYSNFDDPQDGFKVYCSHYRKAERRLGKMYRNHPRGSMFQNRHLSMKNDPLQASGGGASFHQQGRAHRYQKRSHRELRRRLLNATKRQQCELLVECAKGMSQYDVFVYFHSDDIDPADGSIDANIIRFDEADFSEKYDYIVWLVDRIESLGYTDNRCNALLQQFHRTIEYDEVPQWQGATVSQVCLAEGTTVYVKLEELMNVFLLDTHIDDLWTKNAESAVDMVGETFRCAEELFYSSDRNINHSGEDFVFDGCSGSGTSNCQLTSYRFPVDIDASFNDEIKYGDRIYLQVNGLNNRWLTGGRDSGNYNVYVRDMLGSEYETNGFRSYGELIDKQ